MDMNYQGGIGPSENIKITIPDDFYIFRTLYDTRKIISWPNKREI